MKQKEAATFQIYFRYADRDDKAILWRLWIDESENCYLSTNEFGSRFSLSKEDSKKLLTILQR